MRKKVSIWESFPKLKTLLPDKFPKHILIIPDGNGRWAERIHKHAIVGHQKGYIVLQKALRALQDLPIETVSIWGFSADNWKRPNDEIKGLMKLFERGIKDVKMELMQKNFRFIHLGRKDRIPNSLRKVIEDTEKSTKNNKKIFCVAIDFGGTDQELRMMQEIQKMPKDTKINQELIEKLRDGGGIVKPADLIVRTSGEQRTSDLGWLAQNAEFYSIKKYLPDADVSDFVDGLFDYAQRERRFGGRPHQWS